MKKSKLFYWLFLAPCLIAFSISVIIPMITGAYYSFTDWDGVKSISEFIGMNNYIAIFRDTYFLNSFKFTIVFVIVAVICVNVSSFGLALLVTQKMKLNNFFRSVYFMPNLVGGVLVGFTWQFILCEVFDDIGNALGLDFLCNWLSNQRTGFLGLLIVVVWQMSGYMMLVYIAQLQNIPDSLLEAAAIDGAGSFKQFVKVKLPLMMPAFTIGLFLTMTNCFKLYDQNLTLTSGGPAKSTEMLTMNIYNTAFVSNEFGQAQAKGIIFLIVVALITVTQLFITKKKEVEM
ncbi:MAG: sugar ABC transporter permease [Lachnospiraceae bacterium]|nr:sugar ABC transporter permease [Lachnospiraceae bacterium]